MQKRAVTCVNASFGSTRCFDGTQACSLFVASAEGLVVEESSGERGRCPINLLREQCRQTVLTSLQRNEIVFHSDKLKASSEASDHKLSSPPWSTSS
jgi:hypothetical protein